MTTTYGNASGFGKRTSATLDGNTYAAREQIKAWGGRWDKEDKTWTIPVPMNNKACADLAYRLRCANLTWH